MKKTYIAFHKPYGVLSQFTGEISQRTLSEFEFPKGVYAVGRLDRDSEGLLILTNDGPFQHRLSSPKFEHEKCYWVQVEGIPTEEALEMMRNGVSIKGGYRCKPCRAKLRNDIQLPPRDPPIRVRRDIPTSWIEVRLTEGRNRQVRRMTAKIGYPTLRLIRVSIENLSLDSLTIGQWRKVEKMDIVQR